MGFWQRFRKENRQEKSEVILETEGLPNREENRGEAEEKHSEKPELSQEPEISKEELEQESVKPFYKEDQKRFVQECCVSIRENERQIQRAQLEYGQVTEYLTDIQKIDRAEGELRIQMTDLCKKIQALVQERSLYKNRKLTITEVQIRRFDRYEDELVGQIQKMYQDQMYQKALISDRNHLEEEKKKLLEEQREITERQTALKGMAKVLSALMFSLVVLFIALYYALQTDMTLPYLGTLLLAAVSATVIFVEANKNRKDMMLTERKLTKAISLLNRVKIKYVNNTSVLDYDREKYGVKDAQDFENTWSEYCRAKEYERKFRENTVQLNHCNENLIGLLKELEVHDCEIWLSQTLAILDNREMVEVRHELNQRRQKLRDQISYNTESKEGILAQIDQLLSEHPENKEELLKIIRKEGLEQQES